MIKDKVKTDYISETLSWDEYRNIEQQLDALEDKLDQAEDKLESMFRIGD
jgi:tetrahydromethanopterin S-methyltransferase subunit G